MVTLWQHTLLNCMFNGCVVLEKIPHCGILPLVSVYSVKIS